MNTKSLLALLFVSTLLFTSCKKELEPQESSDVKPDSTSTVAATPAAPATITPVQTNQPVQATTAVTPQPAPVAKTAPGMNPPHGQPGHRCEIAVGAPLSSAPTKTQPKMTATPGSATIKPTGTSGAPALLSQPAAATTPTAPGMNPPHGQEGHLCSVAVGAPLPK